MKLVTVVRDGAALEALVPAWDRLAASALEPNPFLESWALLPALRAFGGGRAFVALIHRPDGALAGLAPLVRELRYGPLPVPTLRLFRHDFQFLSTPLLDAGHAREALEALFDWLRDASGALLLELGHIRGDGPFRRLLDEVLRDRADGSWTAERWSRGLYTLREDADHYLAAALDGDARRRLRKKERNLGELGRLGYDELGPEGDVDAWIEAFLRLEQSGWKGRERSAMASEPARERYFRAVAREAFRRRKLQMLALALDGRPVAIKCNLLSGEGAFVFKIAYDEAYGRHSPGMLLELYNIRRMHERGPARWMDSCSSPASRLFGQACVDRRLLETLVIPGGREPAQLLVALLPFGRWMRRGARRALAALEGRAAGPGR
jgi:CelD/BcsL family acetyltransferase involved in cellulose biosynthesis